MCPTSIPQSQEPVRFNRTFPWLKAREIEGTFPSAQDLGAWGISGVRVARGWGAIPESVWPDPRDDWTAGLPDNHEYLAKPYRNFIYLGVRTAVECSKILGRRQTVSADLHVTRQWIETTTGLIDDRSSPIIPDATHAVALISEERRTRAFEFVNSWGVEWGDRGFGQITHECFDAFCIGAWSLPRTPHNWHSSTGTDDRVQYLRTADISLPDRVIYVFDVYDQVADDRLAWAIVSQVHGVLLVEDLFVKPAYRDCGHGASLIARIAALASDLSLAPRYYLYPPDCQELNVRKVQHLLRKCNLFLKQSPSNFAIYESTSDEQSEVSSISREDIPKAPGYRPKEADFRTIAFRGALEDTKRRYSNTLKKLGE